MMFPNTHISERSTENSKRPVVCVEYLDCAKLQKHSRIANTDASISIGSRRAIDGLISPPKFFLESKFHYIRDLRKANNSESVMRGLLMDQNYNGSTKEKKNVLETKGNSGNLRCGNPITKESTKELSPLPTGTPVTRSRSSSRNVTTIAAKNITRRLLPVAAAPKSCPRLLRQTPERTKVAAYKFDSDDNSDSSLQCSPRKRNAETPASRTRSKSINRCSPEKHIKTPTTRSVVPRKGISVARNGRPSPKLTLYDGGKDNFTQESPIKPATTGGRKGKSLLKAGGKGKALKKIAISSPSTSWSSDVGALSSGEDSHDVANSDGNVLIRALNRLHVSKEEFSRRGSKGQQWAPLGRENEAKEIFNFISEHLKSETSGSLFVAGVPGIGKSATIGAVLDRLSAMSRGGKVNQLSRFRLVTVNGFHFATPARFYCEVHRQLSKSMLSKSSKILHRQTSTQKNNKRSLGPKAALDSLNAYFNGKSSIGVLPTVLVVDEMDALVSATSANQIAFGANTTSNARRTTSFGANRVLYNLLEWASTPVSRLVIVAVANTLDLPERALPLRVVSRLGLHRLAFMPYTHVQLESIVRARLATLPQAVFDSNDAVLLAARKVAMASGDARRILELCRLAVERAIRQSRKVATMQDVVAASESLSSATSRLALVRQVAISWRRVLTALVNVCRMQCRDHGACLVRELHAELVDMWREEGGFSRPSDVEVIRIVSQMVACGLLAAEDVSHLGIQAHVQLTMPLPDLASVLASLLGTK